MHDAGVKLPFVLALEPNRVQASRLSSVVRGLHADLTLVNSIDRVLHTLDVRVPDLILIPALLSRKDEASLTDRLRELGTAASHVQTLNIPILAGATPSSSRGVLKSLRRGKSRAAAPDGCDPAVFGAQITEYLARAEEARLATEAAAHRKLQALADSETLLSIEQSVSPGSATEWSPVPLEAPEEPVSCEPEPITARELAGFDEPVIALDGSATVDEARAAPVELAEPVAFLNEAEAVLDRAVPIPDEVERVETALVVLNQLPMALGRLDALEELPQPAAPPDERFELPDQDVALPDDAAGLEQLLVFEEVAASEQVVLFADEPEHHAFSEPPMALAEPAVFEMPPIVVEDSWLEAPQIADAEGEAISLTDVVAAVPEEVPHIETVITPPLEPDDLGAWWVAASVDEGHLPVLSQASAEGEDAWTFTPAATMPAKHESLSEEPAAAIPSPLRNRPGEAPGTTGTARQRPRKSATMPCHTAPTPVEVAFLPPEIVTVHEDACATVIPRQETGRAAQPITPSATKPATDTRRRASDTTRRKGSTTRRKKVPPPVQDEWGLFDPTKCGFSALLEKLDEATTPEKPAQSNATVDIRVVT